MSELFAVYDHLPKDIVCALSEIEQFIFDADGKTLANPNSDGCFIEDGVIVAGDLAHHFNVIVAALSATTGNKIDG